MKTRSIFFLALFVFISCNKEGLIPVDDVSNDHTNIISTRYSSPTNAIDCFDSNITYSNGMLNFQSMEAFETCFECLEEKVNLWNESFVTTYSYLTIEELNELMDSLGFHDEQPLIEFEGFFTGFNSLRSDLEIQELAWLDNEILDDLNDPTDHVIIEEEIQTLFNSDSEVKIGSSIYIFIDDSYLEITDGDLETLDLLRVDTKYTASNIIRTTINSKETVAPEVSPRGEEICSTNEYDRFKKYNSAKTKRIKCVVGHITWPWGRYVVAKTKNYKKNSRGWWRKYSTTCVAKVYGHVSGGEGKCEIQTNFNPNNLLKTAVAKKVKMTVKVATMTKSEWVKGYHYGAGGIEHNMKLTWF